MKRVLNRGTRLWCTHSMLRDLALKEIFLHKNMNKKLNLDRLDIKEKFPFSFGFLDLENFSSWLMRALLTNATAKYLKHLKYGLLNPITSKSKQIINLIKIFCNFFGKYFPKMFYMEIRECNSLHNKVCTKFTLLADDCAHFW